MKETIRGYDTPQFYREDTAERIKRLHSEINSHAQKMNDIIRRTTCRKSR